MFIRLAAQVAILLIFNYQYVNTFELIFDRIELLNSSYVEGYYNISLLRISKFNRTTYVLNSEFETMIDIMDNIEIEVGFYYNRFNNNQYNKSPARIAKDSVCVHAEKYYKKIVMDDVKDNSNLPQYGTDEPVCPIKKVKSIDL